MGLVGRVGLGLGLRRRRRLRLLRCLLLILARHQLCKALQAGQGLPLDGARAAALGLQRRLRGAGGRQVGCQLDHLRSAAGAERTE